MINIFNCVFFSLLVASSMSAALIESRPNSLLVKKKSNHEMSTFSSNNSHRQAHTTPVRRFKHPEGLELVQVQPGTTIEQALATYKTDPSIEYAEPNYLVHALAIPNDPYFNHQWALKNDANNIDINATAAWDKLSGSDHIFLGVLDTGIDYEHTDLKNNTWTNSQEIPGNGIDDDHNGYIDDIHGINAITGTGNPMDDNQHGTHVAGIIGAEGNNNIGISGVLKKTRIIEIGRGSGGERGK